MNLLLSLFYANLRRVPSCKVINAVEAILKFHRVMKKGNIPKSSMCFMFPVLPETYKDVKCVLLSEFSLISS